MIDDNDALLDQLATRIIARVRRLIQTQAPASSGGGGGGTDTFSTSETATGMVWIDGKTIYRKVVALGALPNATQKTVAHGITGMTGLTRLYGVCYEGTDRLPLPYTDPTGPSINGISLFCTATEVGVVTGVNRTTWTGTIIVEYTK